MKAKTLLISTILSTGLMFSNIPMTFATDSITKGTLDTASTPSSREEKSDPRVAAASFLEHVNFARVSLAMKNVDLAEQHISQARNMAALVTGTTLSERRVTDIGSGRIVYQYETDHKYHYFPIQTGPVQVKEMSSGPIWAKNDLAVTDADIVYLTLDLTNNKAESYLMTAEKAINAGNLREADNQLAKLTDEVVTVDSRTSVPLDKARDNIALARNFIAGKNYAGASFALKHADNALDELQNNDGYKAYRPDISTMRKDVSDLQDYISRKDPNMIEIADAKMDKWWKEMKNWAKSKK